MPRFATMFACSTLLSSVAIAESHYSYEISLRYNDDAVRTVEVDVQQAQTRQLGLQGNLQIEFSPGDPMNGQKTTVVQLMRNSSMQVLHTARHSNVGIAVRRIAYVVCGDHVTFMSPTPEALPTCEAAR